MDEPQAEIATQAPAPRRVGTKYPDFFAALAAPFDPQEVKVRAAQGGRQLSYITARTAMNRLDNVVGPENWWDEYIPLENSVVCKLTVCLPEGEVITKCDAGGYAGMADQGDDDKSGFSDSFKRACAKFGVGRYLYRDGVPEFVREREPGYGKAIDTPQAAAAAVGQPRPEGPAMPTPKGNGTGNGQAPRTGKALFAWTKEQEQVYEVALLKYINGWAKLQDFPGRMIEWDADQVGLAYREACRKLQGVSSAHADRQPVED